MRNITGEASPFKKSLLKVVNPQFSIVANNLNKKFEIFNQTQPEPSDFGPHSELIDNCYNQLNDCIQNLDDKLKGVIGKREATYISAFRTLMRKIEKDFLTIKKALETRESQHKAELEMLGEDAIRKQLTYFREECLELNKLWQKSKSEVANLERKVQDQEFEIQRLNELVAQHVKAKIQGPKFENRIASARTLTRSTSPYNSRLPTSDTASPQKSRRNPSKSPKYSKKNIDSTFLKDIFMITMQDHLSMPKENLNDCVERLVELVATSIESRVKEVDIAEKKLEKLKSYYHNRMKSVLGVPFSKPLDDILFHFWEAFNTYKERYESASPLSSVTAGFHSQGNRTKRSATPDNGDTARSNQSVINLTQGDKIKIMDDIFTNTNVLNILARYSEYAKVLSTNKFRFYGMTAKEAEAKAKMNKQEDGNEVEFNSHNEPTFGTAEPQIEIKAWMKGHHSRKTGSVPKLETVPSKDNVLSDLYEITKTARPYTVRPPTSNRKTREKKYAADVEEQIENRESFDDAGFDFQTEQFMSQPPKEFGKIDFPRGGRKYVPRINQSSEDGI